MTLSPRSVRVLFFLLLLLWCFAFSYNSFFHSNISLVTLPVFQLSFSKVCHQLPGKSFIPFNHQLLVCARCTGIYLGALLAALLLLFPLKPNVTKNVLFISLLPLLLDVLLTTAQVYPYSKNLAFLTGLLSGSILFIYILSIIENNLLRSSN